MSVVVVVRSLDDDGVARCELVVEIPEAVADDLQVDDAVFVADGSEAAAQVASEIAAKIKQVREYEYYAVVEERWAKVADTLSGTQKDELLSMIESGERLERRISPSFHTDEYVGYVEALIERKLEADGPVTQRELRLGLDPDRGEVNSGTISTALRRMERRGCVRELPKENGQLARFELVHRRRIARREKTG